MLTQLRRCWLCYPPPRCRLLPPRPAPAACHAASLPPPPATMAPRPAAASCHAASPSRPSAAPLLLIHRRPQDDHSLVPAHTAPLVREHPALSCALIPGCVQQLCEKKASGAPHAPRRAHAGRLPATCQEYSAGSSASSITILSMAATCTSGRPCERAARRGHTAATHGYSAGDASWLPAPGSCAHEGSLSAQALPP